MSCARQWNRLPSATGKSGIRTVRGCLALLFVAMAACGGEDPPTAPANGSIRVTVATTGSDVPSGYLVRLDGGADIPVDANGTATFTGVSAGTHQVELTEVPGNCSIVNPNPVAVAVSGGGVTPLAMGVQCAALVGAIEVTVTSAGNDIPAGYVLTVDGGAPQPVSANGSLILPGLTTGSHTIELGEIPQNCTVTGENPVTAVVESGGSVDVTIAIACTAVPVAVRLHFPDRPLDVGSGRSLPAIAVEVLTETGELAALYAEPVTLEAPGADLQGTTTVIPEAGIARFPDLSIGSEGEYRLRVTAPGLPAAVSDAFFVRFPWASVAAGNISSCGIGDDGALYCWGGDDYESLGNGPGGDSELPARIGDGYDEVSVAYLGGCAIRTGGGADCWGNNESGQAGTGGFGGVVQAPLPVIGGEDFRHVSAAYDFSCALSSAGSPLCWGENRFGQLGDGTRTSSAIPVGVDISLAFQQLTTGNSFACGLTSDGQAYCWGNGEFGALGPEPPELCDLGTGFLYPCAPQPVRIETSLRFKEIRAYGGHICGLVDSGSVYCWGAGGPLSTLELTEECGVEGRPPSPCSTSPLLLTDQPPFSSIAMSGYICGITAGRYLYCWVGSGPGLGLGPWPPSQASPALVIDGAGFESVSVFGHTCGVKQTGVGYCWGGNKKRQLGVGSTEDWVWSPEPIVSPEPNS